MVKGLLSKLFFVALPFLMSACRENTPENQVVVGTNPAFPPFEYKEEKSQKIVGLDIDFAQKIAEKLGKKLVVQEMEFDALIPSLMEGKIDLILSGLSMTEERGKKIDFSFPYYQVTQVVLVNKQNPLKIEYIEDLADKKIGVEKGTTGQEIAEKYTDSRNVFGYSDSYIIIDDLKKGIIDVALVDHTMGSFMVLKNKEIDKIDLSFDDEFYVVGVKKGNLELLVSVNELLKEMKKANEFHALFEKYFPSN